MKVKNRFQRFYQKNRLKIRKKRKLVYGRRKRSGQCTRCHKKALKGLSVCSYHRNKQKEYNAKR